MKVDFEHSNDDKLKRKIRFDIEILCFQRVLDIS